MRLTCDTLTISSAKGQRSCLHSLQILFRVDTLDTDSSSFTRPCSTMGKILPIMTGWSASHSARDPASGEETVRSAGDNGSRRTGGKSSTDGVHDGVGEQHVADVDPRDESGESGDDVRVVDVDGLSDRLESEQQCLGVLIVASEPRTTRVGFHLKNSFQLFSCMEFYCSHLDLVGLN